ncbi:helicase HerA-like domain-containing protein [Lagierella sp.]|uniref:helicase HerA-like domain-containing protein n=1 Tax=Lagierella sp. TaxID=2849657 RepID=UPI0026236A3B|nr:helicase HerA-like domain-containing protein [Lagierella sp.]
MDLFLGKGTEPYHIKADKMNQHGVISGATGSGKTVTLKVICEELSQMGVPSFLSDVKGDLINLSKVGQTNEKLQERLESLGISDFEFRNYPINIWDVYREKGIPLRVTISEFGPVLLSQVLELNETQEGVLNILFKVADEQGLLLLDFKDLTQMLDYLRVNAKEISTNYGNIAPATIASIQRKLLVLEEEGANEFFGEPSVDVLDFMKVDELGNGFINILNSKKLINRPRLYSIFLVYLFSELFEILPEVGNPEKPVAVFFFDEAHLLFNNISKALLEKLVTVVRLIRSKGVGIFFITQNPLDIPDVISSQLGTKIIHQLRAFSPKEAKAVKVISESLRQREGFDTYEEILNLGVGEAVVQTLGDKNIPTEVEKVLIRPPHSSFDTLDDRDIDYLVRNSSLFSKYDQSEDRESAYEVLIEKLKEQEEIEKNKALEEERKKQEEIDRKEQERLQKEEEKRRRQEERERREKNKYLNRGIDSILGTVTRTIGREIARGILGSFKRK